MDSSDSDDDSKHVRRSTSSGTNAKRKAEKQLESIAKEESLCFFASEGAVSISDQGSVMPTDTVLEEACKNVQKSFRDSSKMCTMSPISPEVPAVYAVDIASTPEEVLMHTEKKSCLLALDDVNLRSWNARFPYKIHSSVSSHFLTFNASYPLNRGYASIEREGMRLIEESIQSKTGMVAIDLLPLNSHNGDSGLKELSNLLQETKEADSLGPSKTGYHGKVLAVRIKNVSNPFPYRIATSLATISPLTGEQKVWTNISEIAAGSKIYPKTHRLAYRIPAMTKLTDVNELVWAPPDIHTHPDFSRWINVSPTLLARDLEQVMCDNTNAGCLHGKPLYRIDIVVDIPLTKPIKGKDEGSRALLSWTLTRHLAEILAQTRSINGMTPPEYDFLKGRKTDSVTPSIQYYVVYKGVFDAIVARYIPYMKQDDFLVSFAKGVIMNIACDQDTHKAREDMQEFVNDKNVAHHGSISVTYEIEYERFDPDRGVVDKELIKKREKQALLASSTPSLTRNLQTSSLAMNQQKASSVKKAAAPLLLPLQQQQQQRRKEYA